MIALMLAAQIASAEPPFDLLCNGTLHSSTHPIGTDDRPRDFDKPFSVVLAIDLGRGLYARAPTAAEMATKTPSDIAEASPAELHFAAGSGVLRVNRSTGGYFARDFFGTYEGHCERRPFTPFAERSF